MTSLKEYIIPFKGLKNGVHNYSFDVDHAFFKNFEMSRIQKANFNVELHFEKRDNIMDLHFNVSGKFESECDRCLKPIQLPLDFHDQLVLKISEEPFEDDEIITIDPKQSQIDLSVEIYEMIHVHLPLINVKNCEEENYKDCDPAYVKYVSNHSSGEDSKNPAFDVLNKLKFNS